MKKNKPACSAKKKAKAESYGYSKEASENAGRAGRRPRKLKNL